MAEQALANTRSVLVIGAGTMGAGIAEVAALGGHPVIIRDTRADAVARALEGIRANLAKRVQRGKLDQVSADAVVARLHADQGDAALPQVGLVIEAIVENLDAKAQAFSALLPRLADDVILATNTSSLSVTALAAKLPQPQRVVGMHFFNPAPLLPLVEVVHGMATDNAVVACIAATARAWRKVPVICGSTPGFIVNRIARPFYGEALRLLLERHTDPATLDAVMRDSGGFRMGPCELMDLIGHDINFAVTRSVWQGFFNDPRYQPSLVQQALVDAGWLGRKSGRGFYDYAQDTRPAASELDGPAPNSVRAEGSLGPANALLDLLPQCERRDGAGVLRVDGLALALSDGRSAAERSAVLGEPVILFDLALDYAKASRIALSAAAGTPEHDIQRAAGLFRQLGKQVSLLGDAAGMAVARTVAMLVNEAADGVQQGIASAQDIDAAMTQGVNYPLGPLAWGERLGWPYVVQVLRALAQCYGEDRYRVSPWLQQQLLRAGVQHG